MSYKLGKSLKNSGTKTYHWGDPHPLVGGDGEGLGEGEGGGGVGLEPQAVDASTNK